MSMSGQRRTTHSIQTSNHAKKNRYTRRETHKEGREAQTVPKRPRQLISLPNPLGLDRVLKTTLHSVHRSRYHVKWPAHGTITHRTLCKHTGTSTNFPETFTHYLSKQKRKKTRTEISHIHIERGVRTGKWANERAQCQDSSLHILHEMRSSISG